MKRKKKEESSGPDQGWLMTYGDLMTLLVTFFVLLLTFSSIQIAKFQKAMGSLRGALGVLEMDRGEKFSTPDIRYYDSMIKVQAEIEDIFDDSYFGDITTVELTESRGVRIVLENELLFEPGKAQLKPSVFRALEKIGNLIKRTRQLNVIVEGHTDNIPIHTQEFASNWELSATRALAVLKFFIDNFGIAPARLSAVGHGEYKPLVPNNNPKNRAKNRRVEIFIKFPDENDHY